jgi:hypothetical protein
MNAPHPLLHGVLGAMSGDTQRKALHINRGAAVVVTGHNIDAVIAAMDAIGEEGTCRLEVVKARLPAIGRAIVEGRQHAANDAPTERLPRLTVDEAALLDPKHWWERQ